MTPRVHKNLCGYTPVHVKVADHFYSLHTCKRIISYQMRTFSSPDLKSKSIRDLAMLPAVVLIVVIELVVDKNGSFHILLYLQMCIQN